VHGELLVLGVKVAASTVWEILQDAGIDRAPERAVGTWAAFLQVPSSSGSARTRSARLRQARPLLLVYGCTDPICTPGPGVWIGANCVTLATDICATETSPDASADPASPEPA
jgi:hypothetical protein